jgi:hypothetical protein
MKTMSRMMTALASFGLFTSLPYSLQAQGPTLASLLNGGSVQWGDKLFSQFAYSATGNMPSASDIKVLPITNAGGTVGIEFLGNFGSPATSSASHATIALNVTSMTGTINGAILTGNPSVKGFNPSGTISVTETFMPTATTLSIFDIEPAGDTRLKDGTAFGSAFQSLDVQSVISAGSGQGSSAVLSGLEEMFPQQSSGAPEPASLILVGIGAVTLLGYRRWRSC